MSEIYLDEELLEWALPVLQEYLLPSSILVHLTAYLTSDQIHKIRQDQRNGSLADANENLVRCLQTKARAYRQESASKQNTPIFTALLDVLKQRGYEVLERLLKNPGEIHEWNAHKTLIEWYLPELTSINVKEFMTDLISVGLFSSGTSDYEMVEATLQNEGDEMAMLDILNIIWRKKHNWSKLLVHALRKHKGRNGAVNADIIDTMEKKILEPEGAEVESEERSAHELKMFGVSHGKLGESSREQTPARDSDDDDLASLAASVRSYKQIVEGEGFIDNLALPLNVERPNTTMSSYLSNNLNQTDVKSAIPVGIQALYETSSEFSEEQNSGYTSGSESEHPLPLRKLTDVKSAIPVGIQALYETSSEFSEERNSGYTSGSESEHPLPLRSGSSLTRSANDTPKKLELRPYQLELAEPALEGKNVVIVAPTGSGKTIVAIHIALDHLEQGADLLDHKIAFLVPTVALVAQQERMFKEFLPPKYRNHILGISGQNSTGVPLLQQLNDVNVAVFTPQIFLNAKGDLEKLFSTFTMLIFDECHHTNKDHPYNEIMSSYLDIKLDQRANHINLPQVIGLTASVGVGKAKDETGVEKHIISLAANMDAQKIQTVVRNVDSLLEYANTPEQGIIEVPGRSRDPFSKHVNDLMLEIEKRMKAIADSDCPDMRPTLAAPSDRSHQRYINWQDSVRKEAVKIFHQTTRRAFLSCLKYLEICHNALVLNLDCRTRDALDFMEKELSPLKQEYFDETERNLHTLYDAYKERLSVPDVHQPNPKLDKLSKLLRRETTRADCRTIIFVRTRAMTVALTNWMKSDPTLASLKPNYLTGAGATAGSGGLTQIQQEDLLKAFKQGDHKVVIATSVGEEGLDVQKCNLVIRYEYVTNEIAMMQARGRGRADGAKYFLITDREANRERINNIREDMMHSSLLRLTQMENFPSMVEETQRKARVQRKLKAIEKRRKAKVNQQKSNMVVCVYCLKCDSYACTSAEIRKVEGAHHIVISKDFKQRLRFEPEPKPIKFGNADSPFIKVGKIYCKKCYYDWGVMMLYRSSQMPVIKVGSFILEDGNQQRQRFKKWKDVPIQVAEMSADDWEKYVAEVESEEDEVGDSD